MENEPNFGSFFYSFNDKSLKRTEKTLKNGKKSDIIKKITPQGCGIVGRIPTDFDCDFIVYEKVGDIVYPYLYTVLSFL